MRRVVVTGIGICCDLGNGKEEVFTRLKAGKNGMRQLDNLDIEPLRRKYFGKSPIAEKMIEQPSDSERIEYMCMDVIEEALADSYLTKEDIEQIDDRFALSLATSLTGIQHIGKSLVYNNEKGDWLLHSRQLLNHIMMKVGVNGSCYLTSSACAAGTAGAGLGFDLIKNDEADIALVGGGDHLSMFSIFGFNTLNTLSKEVCKPFDLERDGINLGEGACFFIFEELEHALNRKADIYGEILGYGLGNDAYNMTSPDPKGIGAKAVMNMALKEGNVPEDEGLYINAHGTGTKVNDIMEIQAVSELGKEREIFLSSTKSMTGHCLGAAGSIELAFTIVSLMNQQTWPTIHSNLDIVEDNKILDYSKCPFNFKYALSNSFAFAGHAASILVKKYETFRGEV
ncbi:beta-ketoacyl-[acyl-carrier-protein] synthase family protein [Cellulosilyticum ruminicola]|uniref:beta-ketoacyl-[acyl-carrier-protein] synthase family protein n=1 Tax=Cellulosilyticum ruminicola TaxID=425254 RepID=UPI0006D216E5|nr:beta-ketoacyl-[acyl-carrier-protein] synthase family protein [Cellulosilyticum ruminicola]